MKPLDPRERAEREAADQAEEERVAREDRAWEKSSLGHSSVPGCVACQLDSLMPPYLFADERSQRRVEEEARQERPLDDTYAAWTDQNEQLFR